MASTIETATHDFGQPDSGCSRARFPADCPASQVPRRPAGALRPRQPQQMPSGHIQVDQTTGHEQPVGVLGQSTIADLYETKHTLEHMERMLNLRPYLRLGPVRRLIRLAQRPVPATLLVREILRLWCTSMDRLTLARVGRIAPDPRLVPVQQVRQRLAIMHVRRRRHHCMHQLGLAVDPDVRLHAEMVSRPRQLPPQPLAEPYVTLSRHSALVIQP